MKKQVFGRHFKRDSNERKALFKNLLTSLVLHERIKTTVEKAKAIRGSADKLVTKAKKSGPDAYRRIHPDINTDAVVKMVNEIAPRFTARQGGYTRIIKAGRRVADNAAMAYIEWTEQPTPLTEEQKTKNKEAKKKEKKVVKKVQEKKTEVKTKKVIKETPLRQGSAGQAKGADEPKETASNAAAANVDKKKEVKGKKKK